jgi:tRNA uridine 5-carboxymethylaminomethyl modification enzyme
VLERLDGTLATPTAALNGALAGFDSAPLRLPCAFTHLLRRPELGLAEVWALAGWSDAFPRPDAAAQVEVTVKYAGYVERQNDAVRRAAKMEHARIPAALDYGAIAGLSREVREKLSALRPQSLGQASRIAGVTPVAVALLSVHLRRHGSA